MTTCDDVDPSRYCDVCGCEGDAECVRVSLTTRCDAGGYPCACLQPRGAPCEDQSTCATRNCSTGTDVRRCEPPEGTPCVEPVPACSHCDYPYDGVPNSACRQSCAGPEECLGHGGLCVTPVPGLGGACYEDCTGAPDRCRPEEECVAVPGDTTGTSYCQPP